MSKKTSLVDQLKVQLEALEKIRASLKEHPEELVEAQTDLAKIDKEIEDQNKKLDELKARRVKAQEIITLLTGTKPSERKEGTGGSRGALSKIAFEFIGKKGVGASFSVKELTQATGMMGGYASAWIKTQMDAGFLEQPEPRGPYKILKVQSG